MIYPVNAKEGSAFQVSRERTSSFKWLVSIFKLSRTNLDGTVGYSLACMRLASNPGSLKDSRLV